MIHVMFDYDGTLHDSLVIYAPAVQSAYDVLAERGYAEKKMLSLASICAWIGMTPEQMWDELLPGLLSEEKRRSIKLVGDMMEGLVAENKARLYPEAIQLLERLYQEGYGLILLSNCPKSYLAAHENIFGLRRYFDALYCRKYRGHLQRD